MPLASVTVPVASVVLSEMLEPARMSGDLVVNLSFPDPLALTVIVPRSVIVPLASVAVTWITEPAVAPLTSILSSRTATPFFSSDSNLAVPVTLLTPVASARLATKCVSLELLYDFAVTVVDLATAVPTIAG